MDLADARHGADGVEPLGRHVVEVLTLGEGEHQRLLLAQRRVDRAQRAGATDADRHRDAGKEHGLAQG
ncbi:hypothetical protein D3C83_214150 [compost metagenome]